MQLESVRGIGPSKLKLLEKMGIHSAEELIQFYPFRYEVIERSEVDTLEQDDRIVIDGVVETQPFVVHFKKNMDKMNFKLNTGEMLLAVVIFNRGFLRSQLAIGTKITVIGKFDKKHNTVVASELRFQSLAQEPSIEPIYHSTYGLTGKQIHQMILNTLSYPLTAEDWVPDYLIEKYHFPSKWESIQTVHRPKEMNLLKAARNRLKYEELFLFMMKMNTLKEQRQEKWGLSRKVEYPLVEKMISELPFSLTEDQKRSVDEIYQDLVGPRRMNRLLQGDVGSGKTIVAFLAMYMNYLGGYQSALMAPTEILATQHYANMVSLFGKTGMRIALLTGKMKAKEKREVYRRLESGEIDVLIGTHALISEKVVYHNLGLVITDEQHRFGVNQRGNLKNKGVTPDILYMSATPIPRTYALTLYGDMDISNIKTMPGGRRPIQTFLKREKEIKEVLAMMLEELKLRHQIYVIAPLIEESDKIDLENVYRLEENMKKAFGKHFEIGVLHGKLSGQAKEEIMRQFHDNEIQILISTTVVEVGVDVPNATMIVIFDAFRFGLSALHQLRGRVGRNDVQSYCVLISSHETERLQVLTETTDGFEVSEADFQLRGSGDLFGIRQSGDMSFAIADFKKDFSILMRAKEDSLTLLKNKEYIENKAYNELKQRIERDMDLD